jgi:hypothetical protein
MSMSAPNPDLSKELRFALDVLEENSHLGLDDAAASRVRDILLRQIKDAETALSSRPAAPVRYATAEKTYA